MLSRKWKEPYSISGMKAGRGRTDLPAGVPEKETLPPPKGRRERKLELAVARGDLN